MSACWRCGTLTPSGANFCPSCGTEVRSELPDFELLTEPLAPAEQVHVEPADQPTPPWLAAATIATIVGALVALLVIAGTGDGEDFPPVDPFEDRSDFDALDRTRPDGPDTPTADDNEPRIATEVAPLDWRVSVRDGEGVPLAVVDINGSAFLYTVDSAAFRSGGRNAQVHMRSPTGEWVGQGPMLDPAATVNAVTRSDTGAIATGVDADGAPTVWRSDDGVSWTAERLPMIGAGDPGSIQPQHVAEADGVTVVAGGAVDPRHRLQFAVEERFGDSAIHAQVEVGSPSTVATVRGPFGLVMGEIELAPLGLEQPEMSAFYEQPSSIWEHSASGWTVGSADGIVLNLFALEGGPIVRNEGSNFGSTVSFRTRSEWTDPVEPASLWQVEPWGKVLIGRDGQSGLSALALDLETVRRLSVPEAAGAVAFMAGGADGVATARFTVDPGHEDKARVVVLRDGFTLAADAGTLILSDDTDEFLRGSLHWEQSRDRYRTDVVDDVTTVTFLDEDGNDLVAFTLDELAALQREAESGWAGDRPRLSIFASRDGEGWAGGTIDDLELPDIVWGRLHIHDGHVIAALHTDPRRSAGSAASRFVILEAELPD